MADFIKNEDNKDLKVEEPKVEEPKVEDLKVEDLKVEDLKVEEPKVEEPKVEEQKKEQEQELKLDNICVISITNGSPYDTSELSNNANTYYTNINYKQLKDLYYVIRNNKETDNMIYKTIKNYINDGKTKVFFDFKCCSECHNGEKFCDDEITLLVFKLVNVMTRKGCNIVVGDFSMGALFNNWDKYRMDFKSPINIKSETTSGLFNMKGKKSNIIKSDYPILKNLGDMSKDELIDINFSNMSGTKIYEINLNNAKIVESFSGEKSEKTEVRLISEGTPNSNRRYSQPVHAEFKYRKGIIIISATHWCNLTEVNSEVDIDKLKRQCELQYGMEEGLILEQRIQCAIFSGKKEDVKRVVSDSVKYMCSGKKDY